MIQLDRIDRRILALLQADCSLTAEAMAETIGRSPSVIARRLRHLRASGAILKEVAVIDPAVASHPISILVQVYLERHERQQLAAFRAGLAAHPLVQMIFDLAGEIDVVLVVVARDFAQYDAFADEMLENAPAVRRFETLVIKKRHKVDLAVPLD